MVGVGIDGKESSLARVSVVNYHGAIILDEFVKQRERVVDYRTEWSGIRPGDLVNGKFESSCPCVVMASPNRCQTYSPVIYGSAEAGGRFTQRQNLGGTCCLSRPQGTSAHNKLIPLASYGIPDIGIVIVAPIWLYTRYPAICVQIQAFQKSASSTENPYGSGVRNTNPRRGTLECLFSSLSTLYYCAYLRFPSRSQTPEPQWRYFVYIAVSGKRGGYCPRTPIARTPPEDRRNGNVRAGKGSTILPAAGRRVQAPGSPRLSNVWVPQKRRIRHPWRPRKRPIGGQNRGHRKVRSEYHRVFGSY